MTSRLKVNIVNSMKKATTLGVRVDADLEEQIKSLADSDDRSVSWMLRHLIVEGLKAKGIREHKGPKSNRRDNL